MKKKFWNFILGENLFFAWAATTFIVALVWVFTGPSPLALVVLGMAIMATVRCMVIVGSEKKGKAR